LNGDSEFRLAARYWDGSLQFEFGDDVYLLRLRGGEVTAVESKALASPGNGDVIISAPPEDWAQLLKPIPEPFYQEFYPASMHHGFRLHGDSDYLWPYYLAIRRSGEVLRAIATVED
jgi:hypothetical protein